MKINEGAEVALGFFKVKPIMQVVANGGDFCIPLLMTANNAVRKLEDPRFR